MWKVSGKPEKVVSNSHSIVWSVPVKKNELLAEPFLVFQRSNSVVIYAENAHEEVLLVHQHRFACNLFSWELPQGAIEPNESVTEAASRELLEESNAFSSEEGRMIGEICEAADWSTTKCHLVLFNSVNIQTIGEGELKTKWFNKEEIRKMALRGEIVDAITLSSFYIINSLSK